jgi:hypothetical protein
MVAGLQLWNSMPISASDADDRVGFIIVVDARTALLIVVLLMSDAPM